MWGSGAWSLPLLLLLQWPSGNVQLQRGHVLAGISMLAAIWTLLFGWLILPGLTVAGGVPLLFPSVRRNLWLRVACVAVVSLAPLLLINFLAWLFFFMTADGLDRMARTHPAAKATVREGVPIAAGTQVTEPREGNDDFVVQLKSPVMVDGRLWSGKLDVNPYGSLRSLEGDLAGTYTIDGLPCGPGPASLAETRLSCVLAQPVTMQGFVFAAGTELEIARYDNTKPFAVDTGTLAKPLVYAGATWPAGIVFSPHDATLTDLKKDRPSAAPHYVDLCVPKGQDAMFQGIDLHGPASIEFVEDMAQVGNGCGQGLNARFADFGSLRAAGGVKHRAGNYHYSTGQWEWHDEMYEHEDGRYPTGADPFGLGGDQ